MLFNFFGKKEEKLGIRASSTRELVFQDCRVHKSQLLGREGSGFITAMKTFDLSRPGVGAQALGIVGVGGNLSVELGHAVAVGYEPLLSPSVNRHVGIGLSGSLVVGHSG